MTPDDASPESTNSPEDEATPELWRVNSHQVSVRYQELGTPPQVKTVAPSFSEGWMAQNRAAMKSLLDQLPRGVETTLCLPFRYEWPTDWTTRYLEDTEYEANEESTPEYDSLFAFVEGEAAHKSLREVLLTVCDDYSDLLLDAHDGPENNLLCADTIRQVIEWYFAVRADASRK